MRRPRPVFLVFIVLCTLAGFLACAAEIHAKRFVVPGPDGRLVYEQDEHGNRIPDFSYAGLSLTGNQAASIGCGLSNNCSASRHAQRNHSATYHAA